MLQAAPIVLLLVALQLQPTRPPSRAKRHPAVRMTATAYCQKGKTDSGAQTRRGIIAADPRLLPIGSVVEVDGLGRKSARFVVADTGSAIKGKRIDIFMPSCAAAKKFGRRRVLTRLVRKAADEH